MAVSFSSLSYGNAWTSIITDDEVSLGMGYSYWSNQLHEQCINGVVAIEDRSYSRVGISSTSDSTQVLSRFKGKISGAVDLFLAKAQGSVETNVIGRSNGYSKTVEHGYKFLTKTYKLREPEFLPGIKEILINTHTHCGWEYVDGIRYGGDVFISLSITFFSSEEVKNVKAKIKVSLLGGLIKKSKTILSHLESISQNAVVNLTVKTRGLNFEEFNLANSVDMNCILTDYEICVDAYLGYLSLLEGESSDFLIVNEGAALEFSTSAYSYPVIIEQPSNIPSSQSILAAISNLYFEVDSVRSAIERLAEAHGEASLTVQHHTVLSYTEEILEEAKEIVEYCLQGNSHENELCQDRAEQFISRFDYENLIY